MQRLPEWLTLDPKEVVMVWKQDLAKLKHAFREVGGPPPPVPKPKPKPLETKSLTDEDAMFLAAMGAPALPARPPAAAAAAPPAAVPAAPPVSFEEGLADLKGLKPISRNPVVLSSDAPSAPTPAPVVAAVIPPMALPEMLEAPAAAPATVGGKGAVRIQLAAGMAVEVDATLDLRGHSVPDALGRLGDRLEDGALLGWRTLHLVLGEDPALHAALLGALNGDGAAGRIGRYAQAPLPMGGAQAWVLYY